MLKDISPANQLSVIDKIFERFKFAYEEGKYFAWLEDNPKLTWVQFLADSTSAGIDKAMKQALEVDFIYDLPSVTDFAKLCGIQPIAAPEPVEEDVDTEIGEITAPEPAKQAGDMPQGPRWAQKHYESMQRGVKLPPDTVRMVNFALRLGD